MPFIKVRYNYQITIPNRLRKDLKIAVGDYLEVEMQDSRLILKPVKMIPSDEAYFHTKEWQKGEKQADKDRKKGDVFGPFDNLKAGLRALKIDKI